MKPNKQNRLLVSSLVLAGFAFTMPSLFAANWFWDGGIVNIAAAGNGASGGTAGNWNTTVTNWDQGNALAHVAWNSTHTANFGGTAGAVAVGAGITANGLTFSTIGYSFTTNAITLASGSTITSVGNGTQTFTGGLATADNILRFTNSNTTNNFGNATLFTAAVSISGASTSVQINGASTNSPVVLSGTLSYGGTTTVATNTAFGLSASTITGLASGSISMGESSTLLRTGGNLAQATLDKIATTTNTFTIVANNASCASALNLTNFPNARLAFWDNAGTQSFGFTGAITAGSNGYLFGSTRAGNNINIGGTSTTGAVTANILTGTTGLTLATGSLGNLFLWGGNTFSGNTINNVSGKTISINSATALQNSAIDTSGAGTFILGTGSSGTGGNTGLAITTPTIGGLIGTKNLLTNVIATTGYNTMTSLTLNPGTGATHTYSGVIANSTAGLALAKSGAGTQILSGLNSFAGNVTVSGGTLAAAVSGNGGNSALGSVVSTRTINVNTGGTLRVDVGNVFNNNFASAATSVPALNIAGGTVTNGGTATNSALGDVTLAGGTLTATFGSASGYGSWNLNGTVTSTGASTISSSAGVPITLSAAVGTTTTFNVTSGTLTASAALGEVTASGDERVSGFTKIGAGTLVLSGVNTYTGNAAINVGAVSIATTAALPGYSTNGRYSVASGATLAVQNAVSEVDIAAMLATTNFLSGSNLGFDTTAGDRNVLGNLADTAQGPLGIVKLGANTLTLSGTNTYTGPTTVLAGALYLGSTSSLPNWNVDGGFSVASGASLVIPNTVSEAEVTTILGSTNVASGASLLFDTSLGNRTYTSAITNSTQGLLNIGKIGTNTLTLAGANTHTGNTTLTSGTLNITGSLTGLAASSNFAYGNTPGNTIVNISGSGSVNDYKNFTGANNAGSIAVMNQTGGSASTLGSNGLDTQWVAQNGGYGYLNITGGTFNTGRFDAVGTTGGGTAVVYVGGTGTFNNNSGDWLILPRKEGVGQLTVGPGGNLVRTAAVTANLGITMDGSNARGALNIAGGNVDTGVRPIQFGFGTGAFTNTRGFVNLAGGTLSVGSAIVQSNTNVGGQYFEHFNFGGGTLKSNAAMTWLPAASVVGHTITATIYGAVTNNNNANTAFNTQIGTTSNFTGGLTVDTSNFATTIAYPLSGAGGVGVTQADIGDVSLLSGNSGYIGAPALVFSPPAAPGGVPASGYAVIDVGTGKVNGIVITNPGTYAASETPTVTLSGGGGSIAPFSTSALATANTSGGLTKTGAGTLTLSGASTYTGATSVNVGTLNLTGSLTSSVTVANNANLGGEGSTTGSLTFSGTSDLGFDPSTGGTFLTAGSVSATGASVTVAPTVPVTGTGIVVLDAAGGITGTAGGVGNNFIYTGRGSLYISGTQLLIDTAPLSLAWLGNDGTNPTFWDLNTTTNWLSGGGEKFFTGDGVTFSDFAASFVVDINAAHVSPGNIVFNNTSPNTYTIQGAFGIFGGATLTKNGTGTTVLNTSNGYTGATTVNDGVLNIRTASALGATTAGTSVVAGALEIQGGITTAAEPLTLNGSGISSAGALRNISGINTWGTAVALGSATTIGSDADTLILPSLTGAFGLTKVGAGTLNITGATAVTSTTVEAGTLYMGAQTGASTTTTLGASSAVTLNGSSNLTIRRTNTGAVDPVGAIGGTGSLSLIGDSAVTSQSGDFSMNTASTYSGGTTITGARANITTSGAALGTGLVTTGANGQIFVQTGSLTLTNNLSIGGLGWNESSGFLGALRLNTTTLTGDISLTSNARITGAGTSTLSGIISGSFGMDFFEDTVIGTISLSGNNTYTGTTTINSMGSGSTFPNLIVSHNNALGTSAGGTIVYGTGTTGTGSALNLATGITVTDETLTLDPTASGYRATMQTSGTATWDGNLVVAGTGGFLQLYSNTGGNLTIGSSDTDTVTGTNTLAVRGVGVGTINSSLNQGVGGLLKTDAGTWTITSNNNDFTGTPAAGNGILSVSTIANSGVNSALGAGTSISFGQNAAALGTLQFTGASGGSSNRALLLNNGAAGGAGAIGNTVSGQLLTLSGALTVATPASACSFTLTGAGNGLLSGGIAGSPALALNKAGAGSWTLSGANTYSGITTVDNGTLAFTTSPSLTGGLRFGSAAAITTPGILDLTSADATFGGALLVNTNSATANEIKIGAARTLTFNGNVQIGATTPTTGVNAISRLNMTGGGTFNVATAAAGTFIVGGSTLTSTTTSQDSTMDLTALSSTAINTSATGTIRVSAGSPSNVAGYKSTLLLPTPVVADTAATATLTAGTIGVGAGSGFNSNPGQINTLQLGTGLNTLNANTINVGTGGRDIGQMIFAGAGGDVIIRAADGSSRATTLAVGAGGGGTATSEPTTNNLVDFSGHDADILVTSLNVGNQPRTGALISEFKFGAGTGSIASVLDATNVNIGFRTGTGGSSQALTNRVNLSGGTIAFGNVGATGTGVDIGSSTYTGGGTASTIGELNISGGTVTVYNGTQGFAVRLGSNSAAAGGTVTASMNLTGGTTTLGGDIVRGIATGTVTSTLNISGGTLDMGGFNIGTLASAITLTAESGTLSNVASINGTGGLSKTTAGTLTLAGTNTFTGNTLVNAGTLALADNAQIKFVTGATSGTNNSVTGVGTFTIDGDFNIDTTLTDASVLTTGSWTLVDAATLTETFNPSFTLIGAGWSESANVWTKTVGAKKYTFAEATGILTLSPSASYASWIDGFFPGETDPAIIGAAADPDNDGIENGVEMVIGGNPATGMDTALMPTLELVNADPDGDTTFADYLLFTYRRTDLSVTAGVTANCETDTDLVAPWTLATGAPGVVILTDDNYPSFTPPAANTDRVRVYVPRGANTELFGRLNVEVP